MGVFRAVWKLCWRCSLFRQRHSFLYSWFLSVFIVDTPRNQDVNDRIQYNDGVVALTVLPATGSTFTITCTRFALVYAYVSIKSCMHISSLLRCSIPIHLYNVAVIDWLNSKRNLILFYLKFYTVKRFLWSNAFL